MPFHSCSISLPDLDGKKQLATPKLPLPDVQLVLVVAVKSTVVKEYRGPRNVYSSDQKLRNFFIFTYNYDADESI